MLFFILDYVYAFILVYMIDMGLPCSTYHDA